MRLPILSMPSQLSTFVGIILSRYKKLYINSYRRLPVAFVIVSTSWGYYAFVYSICYGSINSLALSVIYLSAFHILLVFFLWSYWQTATTPLTNIPLELFLPASVIERLGENQDPDDAVDMLEHFCAQLNITIDNRAHKGGPRYCPKCRCIKPDRAHHCAYCDRCILKYDHHCPWVNTCVHFYNYKFFVLLVLYAFLLCIFVFIVSASHCAHFMLSEEDLITMGINVSAAFHGRWLAIVSLVFSLPLTYLLLMHIRLIVKNQTTPESSRPAIFSDGADENAYNYGFGCNFVEIFGMKAYLWFIPTFSSIGDGISFHRRKSINHNVEKKSHLA
ncbi:DHHC palmitoyltransferase domain-containing protein [Ditylenchus destructor]|nr:DHHC palmitoyltransferase domain-containing protein [Ditylenchus destructor]